MHRGSRMSSLVARPFGSRARARADGILFCRRRNLRPADRPTQSPEHEPADPCMNCERRARIASGQLTFLSPLLAVHGFREGIMAREMARAGRSDTRWRVDLNLVFASGYLIPQRYLGGDYFSGLDRHIRE